MIRNRLVAVCGLLVLLAPFAQAQEESSGKKKDERGKVWLEFDRYPSLRIRKLLRMDFRARAQADVRGFAPFYETREGTFDLRRTRLAVQGWILQELEYEVDVALNEIVGTLDERPGIRVRDAYLNLRYFRDFQIQGGKFKIPFSLEQLTAPHHIDLVYRSRIADQLAPARDVGGMLHGRFFKQGLSYQLGMFRGGGENVRAAEDRDTGERLLAARVTGKPLRLLGAPEFAKDAELGFAYTTSNVDEGLYSARGRSVGRQTFFPRMYVNGNRLRLGTELSWMPGPFSVKGEFIHMRTNRKGQSFFREDLPPLLSRGWYLSGSWLLTGEKKAERIEPRLPLFHEGGLGAWEVAARYEQIRFGSSEHPGEPLRNFRAANILDSSDRVWSFGVNWFLNKWSRIQVNAVHETFEDPLRAPLEGVRSFWLYVCRFQFVM